MIRLKNAAQIAIMKEAGRITGEAILTAAEHIREGVSTKFLDTKIREYIEKCGAKPSFLGYGGFPASACISINDEVIHGIPSDSRVRTSGIFLKESSITEDRLKKVRALNEIARARGESLAQTALAWVLAHEGVTSVLIGASKPEQIQNNLGLLNSAPFTEEELAEIDRIALG